MGRAKEIIVKVIPAKIANEFVKKHHYSGKVVNNSSLHFGAFLDGKLHGVMSFGMPMDKSKVLPLVQPSLWNEMLELNRMVFTEYLPKNSESRCFAIAIKMLKKNAPHIKWILSFSDGTQCGDGAIYRASGFKLTAIKENTQLMIMPDGRICHKLVFEDSTTSANDKKRYNKPKGKPVSKWLKDIGAKPITGFQLRYIYLIDKTCKITVPILPFSKIDEMGAGMYKGKKVSLQSRKSNAVLAHKGEQELIQTSGAFDSTIPLKNSE
jgi:hypothetical protein